MKKSIQISMAAAAATVLAASPAWAAVGIHVSGTKLVESNGNTLVLRSFVRARG